MIYIDAMYRSGRYIEAESEPMALPPDEPGPALPVALDAMLAETTLAFAGQPLWMLTETSAESAALTLIARMKLHGSATYHQH